MWGFKAHCFAGMNRETAARPDSMKALDELYGSEDIGNKKQNVAAEVEARCQKGEAAACVAFGLMKLEGNGTGQDVQGAADSFRTACEAKNGKGCFLLARIYDGVVGIDGRGLPRNTVQAGHYFRESCNGGIGEGCYNFAQFLDRGLVPGSSPEASQRRIAKFFALACKYGVTKGCTNYGVMQLDGAHHGGRAAAPDPAAALRTFQHACRAGEGAACAYAGEMLNHGVGSAVRPDQAQAAEEFYAGCRLGNSKCCLAQARMLSAAAVQAVETGGASGDRALHAKARACMFYRRACELGDAKGCQRFMAMPDGLKVIDTRSPDERAWLNVTPETQGKSS